MGDILKVTDKGSKVLLWLAVLSFLVPFLELIGVVNFLNLQSSALMFVFGGLFLWAESGFKLPNFSKKADIVSEIGVLIGFIAIISGLITFFGQSVGILDTIGVWVSGALLFFVMVQLFVK